MPHLKVRAFDIKRLDPYIEKSQIFKYRATSSGSEKEMIAVDVDGRSFYLELIRKEGYCLIRSDKVSRPVDSVLIKKALKILVEDTGLDIIHSNIDSRSKKPAIASKYLKSVSDFESVKFPCDKVCVEIGFGSGRHILHRAARERDTLFVGVEIHVPSLYQLLKNINIHDLKNIWVVNYDARLLMEMLPSNRLDAIFVHFPVPWDKKPHRRVISRSFLDEAMRVLRKGGLLQLRTDSDNYYEYSLALFKEREDMRFELRINSDIPVVSKYEARWRSQDKNIYNFDAYCSVESPPAVNLIDFSFHEKIDIDRLSNLDTQASVYDKFFVHFGRRYERVDSRGGLIECSFGGFSTPEHKYLEYDDEGDIKYFPDKPVATLVNMKAHDHIRRCLYGS